MHCFQCRRDITALDLVARTRHIEQCLDLAPLDTIATVEDDVLPEEESPTTDFKPKCRRSQGLTRSTTLSSAWASRNEQTYRRLAQAPLIRTNSSPHPETNPRRDTQGTNNKTNNIGDGGLSDPVTSMRSRKPTARGSNSKLTKEDRNCPDFQLALALSASLIKPQVSDAISVTSASHQGSRTRKRRSKKKPSDNAEDSACKVQATLTTDINSSNRPSPKSKNGPTASGSVPPSTSVWPVSAAKQLGAQNMWVILRQDNDSSSDKPTNFSSPRSPRQADQSLSAKKYPHLSLRPTLPDIPILKLPPSSIPS
ncbi:hypothetical protein IWQ61_006152, partial [Dispira simplex]